MQVLREDNLRRAIITEMIVSKKEIRSCLIGHHMIIDIIPVETEALEELKNRKADLVIDSIIRDGDGPEFSYKVFLKNINNILNYIEEIKSFLKNENNNAKFKEINFKYCDSKVIFTLNLIFLNQTNN